MDASSKFIPMSEKILSVYYLYAKDIGRYDLYNKIIT